MKQKITLLAILTTINLVVFAQWSPQQTEWYYPKPEKVIPGMITVMLNGIVIQNNFVLKGTTEYIGMPKYEAHGRLPLMLQDHGTEVAFRNIWIRNL